ncbi:hypothetical protein T11_195 [Trichinella zimbabwensis]|uniref:Uncharacterized protein n=1 Tax=Trichinella zimbabwensis TaxID=268475 RepID=A0A0V1H253_9BILA|nr:hypothetical protein T11_195 [Trichinella zimbabwensis]
MKIQQLSNPEKNQSYHYNYEKKMNNNMVKNFFLTYAYSTDFETHVIFHNQLIFNLVEFKFINFRKQQYQSQWHNKFWITLDLFNKWYFS